MNRTRSPRYSLPVIPAKAGIQFFLFAVALLFVLSPFSVSAQSAWKTYTNVRYAFSVDYPSDLFPSFRESDNSDGATSTSKDGAAEMRAFGFYNIDGLSPKATLAERYKGRMLAFSAAKRDTFIASGVEGGAIFYDRCNFAGDRVICVNLIYPAARKEAWDSVVVRVAKSLRDAGRGRGSIDPR